jgi:hypothetical protein
MEFTEFKDRYDHPGNILLFGGKRDIPETEKSLISAFGKMMSTNTSHLTFRTGNAPGADDLFAQAVAMSAPERLHSITPYSSHRKKTNVALYQINLEDVELTNEPDVVYHSRSNAKTKHLVDAYVAGKRDRYSIKAAYILRDTLMVIGGKSIAPASCAFFYDDMNAPMAGGTGHTMNVCRLNSIPYWDQRFWRNWL